MSLNNDGSKTCDSCGITVPKGSNFVSNSLFGVGLCDKCRKEKKLEKKQRVNNSDSSNYASSGSTIWEKIWFVLKWIYCPMWGGPYLAIQGYKTQNKFWFNAGIEFTIVFIIFAILVILIPDLTTSTEPLYIFLSYLFGVVFLINVVGLIVYWVKYKED